MEIREDAFRNCTNIRKIYSESTSPIEIIDNAFPGIVYLKAILYIPKGSKEIYQQLTGWKNFVNIEEIDNFDNENTKVKYVDTPKDNFQIRVLDGGILIKNPQKDSIRIYNVKGQLIKNLQPANTEKAIMLNPHQIYIIKSGNTVKKVIL